MKKSLFSLILIVSVAMIWPVHAAPYFRKVYLGPITQSTFDLEIRGEFYPLYDCLGSLFMPTEYLEEIGEAQKGQIDFGEEHAYLASEPFYVGNLRSYSILVGKVHLVPLQVLCLEYELRHSGSHYVVTPTIENYNQYFKISDEVIENQSPYPLWARYTELYLKNGKVEEVEMGPVYLESGQRIERLIDSKKGIYLTTYITGVNEWKLESEGVNAYGQRHDQIYQIHTNVLRLEALEKLFPPFIVKGKLSYGIGPFEKDEEVEVWRSEKRSYYVIKDKHGKKYNVSMGGIKLPSDTWIPTRKAALKDLEDYVNLKRFESQTGYFVWTDLCRQRTYIFKGNVGAWKLEKTLICSSGKNHSLTPRGTYKMLYHVPYFGEEKGFRCKNGVVLYRDYMYHSILFDKTGKYLKEGLYELGQRSSHGCIRLSEEDSEWLYKNVPLDTTVWIN